MRISERRAQELQEAISNNDTDLIDTLLFKLASNLADEFGTKVIATSFRKALNKAMLNMNIAQMEEIELKSRLNITKLGTNE